MPYSTVLRSCAFELELTNDPAIMCVFMCGSREGQGSGSSFLNALVNSRFMDMYSQLPFSSLHDDTCSGTVEDLGALNSRIICNSKCLASKIYNKRNDYNFEIVDFPFLDGDIHRLILTMQIFYSLFGLNVSNFNKRNKV